MNIAFVSNVVYPFVKGGAEKRIHEIGTRLSERGHTVTIYGRHWWDGPDVIEYEGMTLRAVGKPRELYTNDRRSIREAIEFGVKIIHPLRQHIHEHDVVVASVFPYFPVFGAKLGTLFNDTPLVTTWLEVWDDYWHEYLGSTAIFGKAVERLTAKLSQHPVAISSVTANKLSQLGPDRDRIEILPGGIDVKQIQSISPVDDGFDVLFAGRLISDKNVNMLLSAFDEIASEHDVTLGIIGEGPQEDVLRDQAARLDCSDQITFLGFLEEYEDVLAHMQAAQLFVSPSTREGFGITLAEAMAANCIVITVNHPNSAGKEVVDNGGFVTEVSTSALAEAMERALSGERPPRDPLAVAQEHDWDAITERAEQVYLNVIKG